MTGTYFTGHKKEAFTKWLKQIVGRDDRYSHLLLPDYEEERLDFYRYFERGLSPWEALQNEYYLYG